MLTELMERHKAGAAPLKFLASRSVEPSASGHEGLVFQWYLYFQGISPDLPLPSHTSIHVSIHVLLPRALALSSPAVGDGICNFKHDLTALEMVECSL